MAPPFVHVPVPSASQLDRVVLETATYLLAAPAPYVTDRQIAEDMVEADQVIPSAEYAPIVVAASADVLPTATKLVPFVATEFQLCKAGIARCVQVIPSADVAQ